MCRGLGRGAGEKKKGRGGGQVSAWNVSGAAEKGKKGGRWTEPAALFSEEKADEPPFKANRPLQGGEKKGRGRECLRPASALTPQKKKKREKKEKRKASYDTSANRPGEKRKVEPPRVSNAI